MVLKVRSLCKAMIFETGFRSMATGRSRRCGCCDLSENLFHSALMSCSTSPFEPIAIVSVQRACSPSNATSSGKWARTSNNTAAMRHWKNQFHSRQSSPRPLTSTICAAANTSGMSMQSRSTSIHGVRRSSHFSSESSRMGRMSLQRLASSRCLLRLLINLCSFVDELLRLLLHAAPQRFLFGQALLGRVFPDIFRDLHTAEMGAAHGAEMRTLRAFARQRLIVEFPRGDRIETEIELILPAKLEARFA